MVFAGDKAYAALGGPPRHPECAGRLPGSEARPKPTTEEREAARREAGLPIEGLARFFYDLPLGAVVLNDECDCTFACQGRDPARPGIVLLVRTSLCPGQRCAFPRETLLEMPGTLELTRVPSRPLFFPLLPDLSPD